MWLFLPQALVFCCEANRENSKNRNKHVLLLLFCQLKVHAGKVPEHFCAACLKQSEGESCSQLYTETPGHFIHVNAHKQARCRGQQRCEERQGRTANLGLLLHMSVTRLSCQDEHHHVCVCVCFLPTLHYIKCLQKRFCCQMICQCDLHNVLCCIEM